MSSTPAAVQILCRQCSAPLPVEQGTQLVTCEFCGTSNFVEKGRTVFHYAVRPTVNEDAAEAALRRWMAGNETVKGLDRSAQVERPIFQHFPMWLVRLSQKGQEKVILEPAAALSVSEFKHVTVPASDLVSYDDSLDETAVQATVPYEAMVRWIKDDYGAQPSDIYEVSLVHLPTYLFKYTFDGRHFTAVVDAASGKVYANIYPSKWEVPYFALGAAAFAAYFCAALIPLGGYLAGDAGGLGLGILIYAVAVVVVTVPIFGAAATISAKV